MSSRYADKSITLTMPYETWSLITSCIKNSREHLHNRADYLAGQSAPEAELAGLRRKAAELFDVREIIVEALGDAREEVARAAGAK